MGLWTPSAYLEFGTTAGVSGDMRRPAGVSQGPCPRGPPSAVSQPALPLLSPACQETISVGLFGAQFPLPCTLAAGPPLGTLSWGQ